MKIYIEKTNGFYYVGSERFENLNHAKCFILSICPNVEHIIVRQCNAEWEIKF